MDAILEAKRGAVRIFSGRPGGMRRASGEIIEGYKSQGDLAACLARRTRWGGGALRAFRRAEIIFDVVLFERCVGGVAVAVDDVDIVVASGPAECAERSAAPPGAAC